MPSELSGADGFDATGDGPLRATARREFRSLLAAFLLTSAVGTALAQSVTLTDIVPTAAYPTRLSSVPLSEFRLAVEAGTLAGVVGAGLLLAGLVARDSRVTPSRGHTHATLAAVAFVVAAAGSVAALPTVVDVVGPAAVGSRSFLDVYWLTEVWLFFPVAAGFAAAAPFLLVAATRAGVVGRFTTTRQRGYVALAFVAFAACFSPADGATFVLFAAPLFAGFAAGVAWLELR